MTVNPQPPVSLLYEQMHAFAAEMAEAARANRWSRVVALEQQISSLRQAIEAAGAAPIPDADILHVSRLTRSIIDHIAEVNRHAQPWLAAARQLLGASGLRRRVETTHGDQ